MDERKALLSGAVFLRQQLAQTLLKAVDPAWSYA
jgi:hypothetical protein